MLSDDGDHCNFQFFFLWWSKFTHVIVTASGETTLAQTLALTLTDFNEIFYPSEYPNLITCHRGPDPYPLNNKQSIHVRITHLCTIDFYVEFGVHAVERA